MDISYRSPFRAKNISIILITPILISTIISGSVVQNIKDKPENSDSILSETKDLSLIQGNSLKSIADPSLPLKPVRKIKMVVTAYSSTVWQTDSTPFITASGCEVGDGIIANNLLPFGTRIRIPELYGDKVFEVEDRMHWRKGYYHADIWFADTQEAKNFGKKLAYIEVLEN